MTRTADTTLRRLAKILPPPLRRAASGLAIDVQSLPARLAEPERWRDPWAVRHNVGGGDYRRVGRALMDDLIVHGGLKPSDRVLDIGCGTGRVAAPLAAHLDARPADQTSYIGFDVSRNAIQYCTRRLGRSRGDFRFIHADIANHDYNAAGAIAETEHRFPVPPRWADLAFATSVFTHMRIESIAHYIAETARALAPGGRFLFTAYALTAERREAIAADRVALPFKPWGEHAMVMDPRSPERAIAHDEASLIRAVDETGLVVARPWLRGVWAPGATYLGLQDLFVATWADAAPAPPLDRDAHGA